MSRGPVIDNAIIKYCYKIKRRLVMSTLCCNLNGMVSKDLMVNNLEVNGSVEACCAQVSHMKSHDANIITHNTVNLVSDIINVNGSINLCSGSPPGTILVSNGSGEMVCYEPEGRPGSILTYVNPEVQWRYHLFSMPSIQLNLNSQQTIPRSTDPGAPANLTWTGFYVGPTYTITSPATITLNIPSAYMISFSIFCMAGGNDLSGYPVVSATVSAVPTFGVGIYPTSKETITSVNQSVMLTYNYMVEISAPTAITIPIQYFASNDNIITATTGELNIVRLY